MRHVSGRNATSVLKPFVPYLFSCDRLKETTVLIQERDGWYTESQMERIRAITRRKWFGLLSETIVTDEECGDLLVDGAAAEESDPDPSSQRSAGPKKHGRGKGNKAKKALPPEEIAVRLCPLVFALMRF
jgi:hypothetical protein